MTMEPIDVLLKAGGQAHAGGDNDEEDDEPMELMGEEGDDKNLHLKGQMMFMAEWNVIMFLSSPILSDMDAFGFSGLFVNDLPMHDFSRDLLFIGSQQSTDLKDALDAEMEKTALMEEAMKKLDIEMKKG